MKLFSSTKGSKKWDGERNVDQIGGIDTKFSITTPINTQIKGMAGKINKLSRHASQEEVYEDMDSNRGVNQDGSSHDNDHTSEEILTDGEE